MDKNIIKKMKKSKTLIKIENDKKKPIKVVKKVFKKDPYFQKYINDRESYLKNINKEKYENFKDILGSQTDTKKYSFKEFTGKGYYKTFDINNFDINNYLTKNLLKKKIINKKNFTNYYIKIKSKKNDEKTENYKKKIFFENKKKDFINFLYLSYFYLKKNDNAILSIQFLSYEFINISYLATLYFENVYLIGRRKILLLKFKDDLSKIDILRKIIKDNYHFDILNKKNIKKVILNNKYYLDIDNYFKKKLFIDDSIQLYYEYSLYRRLKELYDLNFNKSKKVEKEIKKIYNNLKLTKDNKYTHCFLDLLQKYN